MRNFIFSLLLLFVTMLFNSCFAQELKITLTMDKTNYLQYETIVSLIELENIYTQKVFITRALQVAVPTSGTEILLYDEKGSRIYSKGPFARIHGYFEGADLLPGQNLMSFINLSYLGFGESGPKNELGTPGMVAFEYRYLPVGKYKIQLSYTYYSDKVERIIHSNICEFRISEPTEDDLIILNEIMEINRKMFSIPETKYPESVKPFLNSYPNHVYSLSVYKDFITTVYQKESDQREYLLKMIEDHPSSFLTLLSVISCPTISEDFRNTASARLKEKSELNKTMLEKYENYQKIVNRK